MDVVEDSVALICSIVADGGAFGYHTDCDDGLRHLGARYYDSWLGSERRE